MPRVDLSAFPAPVPAADLVRLARVATGAGRTDDAYTFMKAWSAEVGRSGAPDTAARQLFVEVCTAAVAARATAWRSVAARASGENDLLGIYEKQLEVELDALLQDLLDLLTNVLVPATAERRDEDEIVYRTLRADAWSQRAELDSAAALRAAEDYAHAYLIAHEQLAPTHPIRLGLVLNYAVCTYERLKDQKKAAELAKKAFDEAISKLDQLDEASYALSTELLQRLRDALSRWAAEEDGAAGG